MKVVNKSDNELPTYATFGSVGADLRANEDVSIKAFGRALVGTGLYVEVPPDTELQIRSRSGMGIKFGVVVLLGVGTVDQDYRGEVKVPLINHSPHAYEIKKGDRIAQGVLSPVFCPEWLEVKELTNTDRGEGGFGHTGK